MTTANANIAIQEMAEHSQKWKNRMSTRTRSTKTSDGLSAIQAQLNNLRREIKKVNEKVYAAQVGCDLCKGSHYTKDCPLKEEGKTLKEAYYTQFGVPFQQGGQSMEESLSNFMTKLAKRHKENSNLIKEIRASTDAAIINQGASIKTLEIQIRQMSKVLHERGFGSLPCLTEINSRDHVKSISTTIDADMNPIHRVGLSLYTVSNLQDNMLISVPNQTTSLFPSRLYYYDEEKGSYRLKDKDAYSIGTTLHNDALPQMENVNTNIRSKTIFIFNDVHVVTPKRWRFFILYQAYGNLYAMTGRKAYLLEDKQIPNVEVFHEVIWETFGRYTHTLDSIWKETGQDCNFTRRHSRSGIQFVKTASQILVTASKLSRDGVRDFGDGV
ncbi:homeodomain-like protein [Tanacetum coccineum]|uniref:Homeodomain-like protein n=1 Tax=Tanacetum coccineum TaxID=301880 RepID=A0ABQ5GE58_9ASTR